MKFRTARGCPENRPSRRRFLDAMVAASVVPAIIPSRVLGLAAVSPSNKITLGVIGVGAQGRRDMNNFLTQDDVRVTALCDVNRRHIDSARGMIAQFYGRPDVKVLDDFRQLNADPSIDAVLMALPVHWHSIPSVDAVLHGKHIYHEKPMAMSFEESRRLREAVRRKNTVFQFGTQQRSDLKFRWACELALNGRLGKLKEVHVSAPGGCRHASFPEQPVPDYVDWDRWVGPAPMTPFHVDKLLIGHHENIRNFSLGFISCWGIHHLDIAQWGNGTDSTGPCEVEGVGQFPADGGHDAILSWKVRLKFATAAPVTFVSDGTPGFGHGVRFLGESGWVHVVRGDIKASDASLLRDPQNKYDTMPIQLPISNHHVRNFLDAIKNGRRAICDIETAVRSDTLCQLALISVKRGCKLLWNPHSERFQDDEAANALLQPRPFRGPWKLPA